MLLGSVKKRTMTHINKAVRTITIEKSATLKTEEMIEILNSFQISGWNGFKGKHPKNVSDGDMFRLEAVINDSEKIYAEGSANFPKGYSEFIKELNKLLNDN